MNKNTKLSRELETILETNETPLEIESTPCWEWISSKFIELAAKAEKKDVRLFIEITFDKNEAPIECNLYIKNSLDVKYSSTVEFPFSMDETKKCQEMGQANGIKFILTPWPTTSQRAIIAFVYNNK